MIYVICAMCEPTDSQSDRPFFVHRRPYQRHAFQGFPPEQALLGCWTGAQDLRGISIIIIIDVIMRPRTNIIISITFITITIIIIIVTTTITTSRATVDTYGSTSNLQGSSRRTAC